MAEEPKVEAKPEVWWKSKKLATATLSYLFVILTEALGLKISAESWAFLTNITLMYLGGQSGVDIAKQVMTQLFAKNTPPA